MNIYLTRRAARAGDFVVTKKPRRALTMFMDLCAGVLILIGVAAAVVFAWTAVTLIFSIGLPL